MSIKNSREIISSNITNRCVYVDSVGKALQSGDVLLFHDINKFKQVSGKVKQKIEEKFSICVFIKCENDCSKLVFGQSKTGNLIIRTLHDKDFEKVTLKYNRPYKLCCISGDYSKMNDEWKEATGYNKAIEASKKWLNYSKEN